MFRLDHLKRPSDIHNGAECKSYRWSQSHSDLEIHVKLTGVVKYEDVDVIVRGKEISVELMESKSANNGLTDLADRNRVTKCLMSGKFERPVNIESSYWLLDNEDPSIVIYVDKKESAWWKKLLVDEEHTESGPKNYTVSMDHLDDGSRMVIDKLIVEQRNKMLAKDDQLSPA